MWRGITMILVVSLAGQTCRAQGAGPQEEIQSPAVRPAYEVFEQALLRAQTEYLSKATAARTKYLQVIETAIKQATRAGDLDEALRLKAEQETILATSFESDFPTLWGSWDMRWSPRGVTRYSFFKQGSVYRELANAPKRGVIKRIGRDLTIDFGNNSIMRVNLAGPRLILEHWNNRASFPTDHPDQFGIGTRVAE